MLNRISQDYPAIPKIWPPAAVFDENTETAVRKFQQIFNLTVDGIVGKATWYKMIYLYNAINDLSELVSEGQRFYRVNFQYPGTISRGQRGEAVSALQYMLSLIGEFYDVIPPVQVDGVYGADTEAAVRAFQQAAGLPADGVAGEQTWIQVYRVFAGLENEYLRNELRFPLNGQNGGNYGQTTRLQQYPGQELTLGRSDG